MTRLRYILYVLLITAVTSLAATPPTPVSGAAELQQTLERLNVLGSMMMFAAHPDDENTAVITYFARGRHIETAYTSATRGEGGQNLIGTEQGALAEFAQSVSSGGVIISVLGDEQHVDMAALEKLGTVEKKTIDQLVGC